MEFSFWCGVKGFRAAGELEFQFHPAGDAAFPVAHEKRAEQIPILADVLNREPRSGRKMAALDSQSCPKVVKPHPVDGEADLRGADTGEVFRIRVEVLFFADRHLAPEIHPHHPFRIDHPERKDSTGAI